MDGEKGHIGQEEEDLITSAKKSPPRKILQNRRRTAREGTYGSGKEGTRKADKTYNPKEADRTNVPRTNAGVRKRRKGIFPQAKRGLKHYGSPDPGITQMANTRSSKAGGKLSYAEKKNCNASKAST